MRRVVITGLGAVTPLGNDVGTFWNALLAGTSGANLITKFDTTLFKTKFACELKNFDPLNYIEKKEASRLDPSAIYAVTNTSLGKVLACNSTSKPILVGQYHSYFVIPSLPAK